MFLQGIYDRCQSFNSKISNYVYYSFCDTFQKVDVYYGKSKPNTDDEELAEFKSSVCSLNGKEFSVHQRLPKMDVLHQEDVLIQLSGSETEIIFEKQIKSTMITYRKYFLIFFPPFLKHAIFTECARMTKPALAIGTGLALFSIYDKSLAYTAALATAIVGGIRLIDRIVEKADKIKSNSNVLTRDFEERIGSSDEAFLNADGTTRSRAPTYTERA